MAYVVGKLVFLVLRPSNLLLLLALLGLVGLWRRRRWGMTLATVAILAIAACTLLPVGRWISVPLEDRFPPPDPAPARVDGIVVLGGGVLVELTEARRQPSFGATMERFAAIPQLLRRYPDARVLFTGGPPSSRNGTPSEAWVVGQFLAGLGLPSDRVTLEDHARSTLQNALFSLPLAQPRTGETWLLVTSASHMPRAMGTFRGAGWPNLVAWPVDYRSTGKLDAAAEPRMGERLDELDQAAYEWLGLVYYRILGYTDAVFPGP
jgi:uncharacterized SAM-binding protein YcdF (DUF218 family)